MLHTNFESSLGTIFLPVYLLLAIHVWSRRCIVAMPEHNMLYCKFTFRLNIACSVNDCAVEQQCHSLCSVCSWHIGISSCTRVRRASISSMHITLCNQIYATRNVQMDAVLQLCMLAPGTYAQFTNDLHLMLNNTPRYVCKVLWTFFCLVWHNNMSIIMFPVDVGFAHARL